MSKKPFTYKDAGVDIQAGEEMVDSIKSLVKETHNDQVLTNIGGFGGLFAPDLSGFKKPVFVSSVDGVGTKLIVAFKMNRYNTVGQDLVNHCINDIAVCGATPLFFLDYFSTGRLDKEIGYQVVKGFATACKENGLALIGGETAEMPDIYKNGEFDLAGTIVGIVDKERIITGEQVSAGDSLIAVPSSGLHTNGYSLARRVLFESHSVTDFVDEIDSTVGDALLKIHRSYLPIIGKLRDRQGVHAFSHITGGGIEGNTRRVLPDERTLAVNWQSWSRPPIFELIKRSGSVPEEDMRRTFNLGVGLVIIADNDQTEEILSELEAMGENPFVIGSVE